MKFSFLADGQIEELCHRAYQLLDQAGIQISSEEIRRKLVDTGSCREEDERVFIKQDIIEQAIKLAPNFIELHARESAESIIWGAGQNRTLAGIGVTNLNYWVPETDEIKQFDVELFRKSILLGNSLSEYEIVSTTGIIQEALEYPIDLVTTVEILANTTKPLMLLVSDDQLANKSLGLYTSLVEKNQLQSAMLYVNPISPLRIPVETTTRMIAALDHDFPLVYSIYSMMGATAPILPETAFVMHLAELFAGLVIAQTIKPGAEVALGMLPARFDMAEMVGYYDYTSFQMNAACADVMDHLGIPHAGTSGSGNGWGADIGAIGELWFNHFSYALSGKGLMPFIGGLFDSLVFSPELVVYGNEVLQQIRNFTQNPFGTGGEYLTKIAELINNKDYLMAETTLNHFKEFQPSRLSKSSSLENWIMNQKSSRSEILKEETLAILANLKRPNDQEIILKTGYKLIKSLVI